MSIVGDCFINLQIAYRRINIINIELEESVVSIFTICMILTEDLIITFIFYAAILGVVFADVPAFMIVIAPYILCFYAGMIIDPFVFVRINDFIRHRIRVFRYIPILRMAIRSAGHIVIVELADSVDADFHFFIMNILSVFINMNVVCVGIVR